MPRNSCCLVVGLAFGLNALALHGPVLGAFIRISIGVMRALRDTVA